MGAGLGAPANEPHQTTGEVSTITLKLAPTQFGGWAPGAPVCLNCSDNGTLFSQPAIAL